MTVSCHRPCKLSLTFQVRASDSDVEAAWRAVEGQGSGISWHYLGILAAVDDVKASKWLSRLSAVLPNAPSHRQRLHQMLNAAYSTLLHDYPGQR